MTSHIGTTQRGRIIFSICFLSILLGCGNLSDQQAERLVRNYNACIIEAYRTADYRLVEPYAGREETRKITALIGVKRDMGYTLDAELLELSILSIEKEKNEVQVRRSDRGYA